MLIEPHFLAVNLLWCSVSFASFVMCTVATTLSLHRFCWKAKTVSTERTEKLLLYLVIFSTAYAGVNCFQWFRLLVQHGKPETGMGCTVVGFGIQYCGTGILVITLCTGIHLLLLVCRPKCLNNILEKKKWYRALDFLYLIIAVLVPLLFVPWPWINGRYGDAGHWCWIEVWDESCNRVNDGFYEQIFLWYFWVLVLMAFSAMVAAITLGLLCYVYYKEKGIELDPNGYINIKIYTLLIYLVLCLVVNVIGLTNHSIQWRESGSPYPLLVLHALTYPLWGCLSAMAVYVVVYFNRKEFRKRHQRFKARNMQNEAATIQSSFLLDEDTEFTTSYVP